MEQQTLAGELVDYRQHADPAAIGQPLSDEIHAPLLVGADRLPGSNTLPLRSFPPLLRADATAGQLSQSHAQRFLRIAMMLVTLRCPMHRNQPRDTPLTELMGLLRPLRQLAARPGPQSFFATISCRTCRSSERSATSRFSFPFSSRS